MYLIFNYKFAMILTQVCEVNLCYLENEIVFWSLIFDMSNNCGLQLDIVLFKSIYFNPRWIVFYKAQTPIDCIENAFQQDGVEKQV